MLAVQLDWSLFGRYKDVASPLTLGAMIVGIGVAIWLVLWLRARFREDSGRAEGKLEMLSQFRELRLQGELTEDEFRLIKSRLVKDAATQLNATSAVDGNSARHAEGTVRRVGGIEKTGETGQDASDLEQSRSADEPPNENSTTMNS